MKPTSLLAAATISASLLACSSSGEKSNAAPIIDSIDAPADATQQNGQWAVPFTIKFHDADKDAITGINYKLGGLAGHADAQGSNPDAIGAQVTLVVPSSVPKGTYDIAFTVVDARGAESAPVNRSIILK